MRYTFDTNIGLVPLINFGVLNSDKQIYRSGQPLHHKDYVWLHDVLGVQNIIDLRAESNIDEIKAPEVGIKVWKIPVIDGDAPSLDQGDEFTSVIHRLIISGESVLIHCEHGHGRTSTFCVLAQLVMGMDFDQALEEEASKFKYGFHHEVQTLFLKKYYALRYVKA